MPTRSPVVAPFRPGKTPTTLKTVSAGCGGVVNGTSTDVPKTGRAPACSSIRASCLGDALVLRRPRAASTIGVRRQVARERRDRDRIGGRRRSLRRGDRPRGRERACRHDERREPFPPAEPGHPTSAVPFDHPSRKRKPRCGTGTPPGSILRSSVRRGALQPPHAAHMRSISARGSADRHTHSGRDEHASIEVEVATRHAGESRRRDEDERPHEKSAKPSGEGALRRAEPCGAPAIACARRQRRARQSEIRTPVSRRQAPDSRPQHRAPRRTPEIWKPLVGGDPMVAIGLQRHAEHERRAHRAADPHAARRLTATCARRLSERCTARSGC